MSQKPHKNRFFVGVGGLKRLVSFSVKEKKQPMQHGTGDLVLIQTTPAYDIYIMYMLCMLLCMLFAFTPVLSSCACGFHIRQERRKLNEFSHCKSEYILIFSYSSLSFIFFRKKFFWLGLLCLCLSLSSDCILIPIPLPIRSCDKLFLINTYM